MRRSKVQPVRLRPRPLPNRGPGPDPTPTGIDLAIDQTRDPPPPDRGESDHIPVRSLTSAERLDDTDRSGWVQRCREGGFNRDCRERMIAGPGPDHHLLPTLNKTIDQILGFGEGHTTVTDHGNSTVPSADIGTGGSALQEIRQCPAAVWTGRGVKVDDKTCASGGRETEGGDMVQDRIHLRADRQYAMDVIESSHSRQRTRSHHHCEGLDI